MSSNRDAVVASTKAKLPGASVVPDIQPGWIAFEFPEASQTLSGKGALGELLGVVMPGSDALLPRELLEFHAIELAKLALHEDGSGVLGLRFASGGWVVFRDWVEIAGAEVDLRWTRVDESVSIECAVFAQASFHGIAVDLALSWPERSIALSAKQSEDPVTLGSLLRALNFEGSGFDQLALRSLVVSGDLTTPQFDIRAVIADACKFSLGPLTAELREIDFHLFYAGGAEGGVAGDIVATATLGTGDAATSLTLIVSGSWDGNGGWSLEGRVENLDVAAVFAALGARLPAIDGLTVEKISVAFQSTTKAVAIHFAGALELSVGASARILIDATLAHAADGSSTQHLQGELTIGTGADSRTFELTFDNRAAAQPMIVALYRRAAGEQLSLATFARALGADVPALQALNFTLRDALLVLQREDNQWKFVFAAEMDFGLDLSGLSSLPLIGSALPREEALKLSFKPVFATLTDSSQLKERLPAGSPELPDPLPQGFTLQIALRIGGETKDLTLSLDSSDKKVTHQLGTTSSTAPAPTVDASASLAKSKDIRWINLQKRFGPVHLARLGVGIVPVTGGQAIAVALDASLTAGPLEIALDGLGAVYDLQSKQLSFQLDGLALEFSRDPIQISGAFLRLGSTDFAGKVVFRAKTFTLAALGAYGEVQGHPSLFIYGFLDYPIGGPSFFFVEGLALGFGFNRRLIPPPIERIHEFPLVAEAIGSVPAPRIPDNASRDDLAQAIRKELTDLITYVPPELGQYLLVVGIKFSSFKLIDSFALLTVGFGARLDVTVMGVSTLVVPCSGAGEALPPIAVVRMAFLAHYDADNGALVARAQLTPDSYLFSTACRLQGGFAFASWLKGEHAGDFVATLGGYHPSYRPPAHYPQNIPRLGFQWRVNDEVFIKGSAYYALTPCAVMAGGRLEANFDSGSIHASFVAGADFLMSWKPFHYDARVYVEVYASVVIEFFGTHHLSISAGADLHIWGPEFAGTADVYVKVIGIPVEFTVEFGAQSDGAPPKIDWNNFATSFLPADAENSVCSLVALGGLQRTVGSGATERWIVNAKELAIALDSLVPSTRRARWTSRLASKKPADSTEVDSGSPAPLGIEPMGVTAATFVSNYVVQVTRDGEDANDEFVLVPRNKKFPRALWNPNASMTSSAGLSGDENVDGLAGYVLQPATPPKPGATSWMRNGDLQYEEDNATRATNWVGRATYYKVQSSNNGDPASELGSIFARPEVSSARDALLRELGFDPARDVDLGVDLSASWIEPPTIAGVAFASTEPMSA